MWLVIWWKWSGELGQRWFMEWSVIYLAPVFWFASCKWPVRLAPRVAGNLARDIGLGNDGGNAVLLLGGPVSKLGDLCYKNWTTAVVSFYLTGWLQCMRTCSIHMLMWVDLGVTCHYSDHSFPHSLSLSLLCLWSPCPCPAPITLPPDKKSWL